MMKAGKELNLAVSQKVLGYAVASQKGVTMEATPKGTRPLRNYSSDIAAAWEVAEKLGITLIPISDGSWFAFIGEKKGWDSPADFIRHLGSGDFVQSGAAVTESAPLSICLAAITMLEKRTQKNADLQGNPPSELTH